MAVSNEDKRFLKKLGLRLRAIREEKGWTLEETEERGWSDWKHLQTIEAGKNLTVVSLRRIAKVYRISLADIFSEIE
jgi:transcriptional regulator with XRE-family HTH domain